MTYAYWLRQVCRKATTTHFQQNLSGANGKPMTRSLAQFTLSEASINKTWSRNRRRPSVDHACFPRTYQSLWLTTLTPTFCRNSSLFCRGIMTGKRHFFILPLPFHHHHRCSDDHDDERRPRPLLTVTTFQMHRYNMYHCTYFLPQGR